MRTRFGITLASFLLAAGGGARAGETGGAPVRFGIAADAHLQPGTTANRAHLETFVQAMAQWQPDFTVDLGDFAVQTQTGPTTQALQDAQWANLEAGVALLGGLPCPHYYAIGNHDVGWIRGGAEEIGPTDLLGRAHAGEHLTKDEFLLVTGMPQRYYSFVVRGVLFIVLDSSNAVSGPRADRGHDGVAGAYGIDPDQVSWLAATLAANRARPKIVFCHAELHHTPLAGSGEGGDAPFPPVGKEISYVDNGWELRRWFAEDGNVLACFSGHKHESRWVVYGGVNYITVAALHAGGSYARVTLTDRLLLVQGTGSQAEYKIALDATR